MFLKKIFNFAMFYCKHSHLHGLRYVGLSSYHILVRLLWYFLFMEYCYLMSITFVSVIQSYRKNAVTFLTETSYLDWNTTFPAVSVCQIGGIDYNLVEEFYNDKDSAGTIEYFVSDVLFFSGSCYSCHSTCYSCSEFNITYMVEKLRKPCNSLLTNCEWNGISFNCCEEFQPVPTEYGVCFALNSLQSRSESTLNFIVNHKTSTGELKFRTKEDVRVYIHAPEDVPYINSDPNLRHDVLLGESFDILFNVEELVNDNNVFGLPIVNRGCRYPEEVPDGLKVHKYYSYSACVVQCHADEQLRLCNCTHHLMPYYNKDLYCDLNGLKCLTDNFDILSRLHARGSNKPGLTCDCHPSCTEPEYNIVGIRKKEDADDGMRIKMQSLPTTRYKRVLSKSMLDLVVAIGGTAGLFIGASLQTVVELFYLAYVYFHG